MQPSTQPSTQWRSQAQPPRTYEAPSSNAPQQSLPLENAFKSFMQVHAKSVEEQDKINKQLGEEQSEIKSQLTKLTNSLAI